MGFADSIRQQSRKILEEVDKKCFSITFRFFNYVIQRSPSPSNPGPYAKGLLANQWYPMVGNFSTDVGTQTSPNGSDSLSRINDLANANAFLGKDGSVTMTNNLPYAYIAEKIGWTSDVNPVWKGTAKPYRMVELALQQILEENRK